LPLHIEQHRVSLLFGEQLQTLPRGNAVLDHVHNGSKAKHRIFHNETNTPLIHDHITQQKGQFLLPPLRRGKGWLTAGTSVTVTVNEALRELHALELGQRGRNPCGKFFFPQPLAS
jgi:hypothetical protein